METFKAWDSTVPMPNHNYLPPRPPIPPRNSCLYNQSNILQTNFSQLAFEESRSAFHSIESFIQTIRSISNVFESTLNNIYTSFRAMTDLYDHFIRLRSTLTTISIFRSCQYFLNCLLKILHLRNGKDIDEYWPTISDNTKTEKSSSNLFFVLFFLVSFGTPMLMLKFLNSILKNRQIKQINRNWLTSDTNSARVIALHDYVAQNPDELSFTRGTIIHLAPAAFQSSSTHWFLGTIDRIHTGLIPANFVQPIRTTSSPPQAEVPINSARSSRQNLHMEKNE